MKNNPNNPTILSGDAFSMDPISVGLDLFEGYNHFNLRPDMREIPPPPIYPTGPFMRAAAALWLRLQDQPMIQMEGWAEVYEGCPEGAEISRKIIQGLLTSEG